MIGFSFYRMDWMFINLVILLPLVIFFSVVFIWRYIARWGKATSPNLEYRKISGDNRFPLKYWQVLKKNSNDIPHRNVIVFTPSLIRSSSFLYFITALGIYDCNVYMIKARPLIKYIKEKGSIFNAQNDSPNLFHSFMEIVDYFQADVIISFDIMCFFLDQIMQCNPRLSSDTSNLSSIPSLPFHINIRPCNLIVHSHLFKLVPFTYRWWYVIFLLLSGLPSKLNRLLKGTSIEENKPKSTNQNLSILPKHSLIRENILRNTNSGEIVSLDLGWFNFRFAETIALAHILNQLDKIKKITKIDKK
jgi:hypothetical protein